MSSSIGPNIAKDGLVFDYDIRDPKSWRGKPTTNYMLYPDNAWNGTGWQFFHDHDSTSGGQRSTYTNIPGLANPAGAAGVLRYYTGSISGYKYFSFLSSAVPTNGFYTMSFYVRIYAGPAALSNFNNEQLWRDGVIGDQWQISGNWNSIVSGEWMRYTTTNYVQAGSQLQYFPIHGNNIPAGYYIDYCGLQLEPGTVATPWVNTGGTSAGSRTTTNALNDRVGNVSMALAPEIAYDTDGTPKFQGTVNSYIQTYTAMVPQGAKPFTVSSWVKRGTRYAINNICSSWTYANSGNSFMFGFVDIYGEDLMRFSDNWDNAVVPGSSVVGVWQHYTAVNEGTGAKIYLNGELKANRSTPLTYTGTGNLVIGRQGDYTTQEFFNGEIDSIQVYNRALSAAEVKKNYEATKTIYGV